MSFKSSLASTALSRYVEALIAILIALQ